MEEVVQELVELGFSVQREPKQSGVSEGTVLSLNPIGQVPIGTTITVSYSTGRVDLPVNILGQQADLLIQDITEQGVNVIRYDESGSGAEVGTIVRTNPVGGSSVRPGDTVEIWVAVDSPIDTSATPTGPGMEG